MAAEPVPQSLFPWPGAPGAMRLPGANGAAPEIAPSTILIEAEDPGRVEAKDGVVTLEMADGSVVIKLDGEKKRDTGPTKHYDNLADRIDAGKLGSIGNQLLTDIDSDIQSRTEWLATRARGIELLGLKIEGPRSGADSTAPLEGMSTVRHPLLLEATLRAQATARGELLPADGPVKIANTGPETAQTDKLAEDLQREFNTYLTTTATEYYPDTDRMLFFTSFGGSGFKKVYNCPLRRRPVSESVDAEDIIVNYTATDMRNAGRITHRILMRQSMVRRLQNNGHYRETPLTQPNEQPSIVDQAKASAEGMTAQPQQPQDNRYTIYECYTELDLPEYGPKGKSMEGVPLPFKVTIDRDSREVLEVRRNWRPDDEECLPRPPFVKYPYIPGIGFYDLGLVHVLGNTTNALTAAWREMLDAGMFANFPGFLYTDSGGRQLTNQFRVPPGGGMKIQTSGKIGDAVMPLPYKDVTPGFMQFVTNLSETAQRLGGTAEAAVGEGKQDVPVGTILAMIEQSTKVQSAVHKRQHQAQSEEFGLLIELFREDPSALWRHTPEDKRARKWEEAELLKALADYSLVPKADPNVPSHTHRMLKASALYQMGKDDPYFDQRQLRVQTLQMMGYSNADSLIAAGPPPPQADPAQTLADAEIKKALIKQETDRQNNQVRAATALTNAQQKEAEMRLRMEIEDRKLQLEALRLAGDLAVHPESEPVVSRTLERTGVQ
jgi:hypothetical protein